MARTPLAQLISRYYWTALAAQRQPSTELSTIEEAAKHMVPEATLHGGPFDGEKVFAAGRDFRRNVCKDLASPPREWKVAVYTWEKAEDGSIIGVFQGFKSRSE